VPKSVPDPRSAIKKYPHETEIGCLNRAHRQIVDFKIPRGRKNAKCPVCGRRAGKK
jgi:hypothetical protein